MEIAGLVVKLNGSNKTITIASIEEINALQTMELVLRVPEIKKIIIAEIVSIAIKNGANGNDIRQVYDELSSYAVHLSKI